MRVLQGGTQDNGTWESDGSPVKWENKMIGDGGQSGFDVAIPDFRFHTFTGPSVDVNFANGDIGQWIWTGAPLLGINGITIVCHGRSNANAIKNGIRVAYEFCKNNVNSVIERDFRKLGLTKARSSGT